MSKLERDDETIENRVYLFESLARAFVEKAADDLSARNPDRRSRALRALADLAYVSCAVADTQHLPPKAVRRKVLHAIDLEDPIVETPGPDDEAE